MKWLFSIFNEYYAVLSHMLQFLSNLCPIFAEKKIMEQLHAHEVLHMMKGNSYSESSLKKAIIEKFGEDQRFYTCSAENMDIDELIEFLKMKGKFMSTDEGFTVDITKVCNH